MGTSCVRSLVHPAVVHPAVVYPALVHPAVVHPAALDRLAQVVWSVRGGDTGGTTTAGARGERPGAPGGSRNGSSDDADALRVEALVALAQKGDADAFGEIYELYVDTVYRYVYVRVGSRQLAEDITSETFLRALRRLDGFTWQGRDIAAWFITIARNLVIDHRKSSRFRLEVTTDEIVGLGDGRAASPTRGAAPAGPEAVVVAAARNARLVEALRTLRPDQQECLVLRFLHELSLAETALAMGRSEGAIKQLQLRGIRALAAVLRPDEWSDASGGEL